MVQLISEVFIITELVKKFPAFVEAESSLSCLQTPANSLHPEAAKSSEHLHTIFTMNHC
jgi:hypothetical protein